MTRFLRTALFLEVGFILIVAPWSTFWERNYFADAFSHLHVLVGNPFVRGAVSGLGVVNVVAGIAELASMLMPRRAIEDLESGVPRQPH